MIKRRSSVISSLSVCKAKMTSADCTVCGRKNTKYRCTICSVPICNACSVSVDPDSDGYDEENYCVGKCKEQCAMNRSDCDTNDDRVPVSESSDLEEAELVVVSGNNLKKAVPGKQTNISSFFRTNKTSSVGLKRAANNDENAEKHVTPVKKRKVFNINTHNKEEKNEGVSSRQVRIDTIEKSWKDKLAIHDVSKWFSYEENSGNAINLKCLVCLEYEESIKHMKGFSRSWITGCQNYKLSAPREHAESDSHKHAMKLYYKAQDPGRVEDKPANQRSLLESLNIGDERTKSQIKKKFEVAYFCAKEEMSFHKYPAILKLEEMHGVDVGQAYRDRKNCAEFIDYLGKDLQNNLSAKVQNANFYSILFDGSTDESVKEQEGFYVLLFDPQPDGKRDTVEVKMNYFGIQSAKASEGGASAKGLKHGVNECFKNAGVTDYAKKLIGFCSDGANVNKGDKGGVMAEMKVESPWLVFVWCMAHRLELAVKECLGDTKFKDIDEMLLNIYLLYEKSSKKLGQLAELCEHLKDMYEFTNGSLKPVRSNGTRWIAHKIKAMRVLLDKYGLYMKHLAEMAEDKSYKSDQRAKIKGYLTKWKKTNMLMNMAFYLDALQPVSYLSLSLQREDIDPVRTIEALLCIQKRLEKLKSKSVNEFTHLVHIKNTSTINDEGHHVYQGIVLKQRDAVIEKLSKKKDRELQRLADVIHARLNRDCTILKPVARILNAEAWVSNDDDDDEATGFADRELRNVFRRFSTPLRNAGVILTEEEILEEWHNMVEYAQTYLSPGKTNYLKTWRRIFDSSRAKTDFKNVLLLVEICFVMPLSNAQLERLFSRMKRIKSKKRCSLSNERLGSLIHIGQEGMELSTETVMPAMSLWAEDKERRPNSKSN